MSFEAMRQHQRKVYLPLAIVVTVTFVFWGAWNASQRGCSGLNRDETVDLDYELKQVGEDLQKAGLIQPPPRKIYEEQAQREFADLRDDRLREDRVRDQVRARCRRYYRDEALRLHYLPMKEGERLGVRVSDEDLGRRIRQFVEVAWGHKEFNDKAYQEELSARSLKDYRFENLILGRMIGERLGEVLSATAGASESELYYVYARERQQVRVQYFQRSPAEFLAQVEVRPGDRPSDKPADKPADKPEEKAGGKAPAKEGEKPAEPAAPAGGEKKADGSEAAPPAPAAEPKAGEKTEKKEPPKDEIGVIYEGEIPKKFEDRCEQIKDAYGYKEDKDFEWPSWLVRIYPDMFSEARAGVECLLALTDDFEAGIKIPDKDIEEYYKNNKREFEEKPAEKSEPAPKEAPKDAPKAEAKVKPLAEVRKEIEKKLIRNRATDAAAKALDAALKEYNDLEEAKRPKQLSEFAAKHKPLRVEPAVTGTLEELEEKKYLDGREVGLGSLFDRTERTELGGKLTDRRRLGDDLGFVAVRVTEFHPVAMLKFDDAKAGFTHRMKYVEAWKLAKQAIDADLKALEDGKLDPVRVRESRMLGPGGETCDVVGASGQGKGEASMVYRYKEALGPEKEEEDRKEDERRKAREGDKKEPREHKTIEERVVDALDSDQRSGGRYRGYRVVVLVERRLPTFDQFVHDRGWRQQWSPDPRYLQIMRQFGQTPGDLEWRQDFIRGYFEARYSRLTARD